MISVVIDQCFWYRFNAGSKSKVSTEEADRMARPSKQRLLCSKDLQVFVLLFLSSCSAFTGYPKNYQDTSDVLTADQPYLNASVRTTIQAQANPEEYRNNVVYARIEVIDINYYNFESKLLGTYDGLSLGAGLTTLILNGLGATTGSAETKSALAAASAGVVGASGAVSTDIFYQKTLPALVAEMRAARQSALVPIMQGLQKPISAYPLSQALMDVNNYYVAGTLPSAVSSVTIQAGAQQSAADAQLADLRSVAYVAPVSGSSAAQILAWLYPSGPYPSGDERNPVNTNNLTKLEAWMNGYSADPLLAQIPYQNLLTGSKLPDAEADRQQAIKDLQIPETGK
jgi:hypothetical protein